MSLITSLTRMRLTRSVKPFIFNNEYDNELPFDECDQLGLYVHIPFCRKICSFCPYCKQPYDRELCNKYIDSLLKEIELVTANMRDRPKAVTSLYFGGGTPALAGSRLKEIIDALNKHFDIKDGIGLELHPDDMKVANLKLIKNVGVSKISIGIQSFQDKYQDILGRKSVDSQLIKDTLSQVSFETVSMDFIFALPGQTFEDIKRDIDTAFEIGANHIAIYPFIDFDFTSSKIPAMSKKEKRALLDKVTDYCESKGYERNSIWTFANTHEASYSSMTRDNFLGFGCSATTLLQDQFKINTFSVEEYCKRIGDKQLPTSLTIRFTKRQRMVYYLFWKLYSTRLNPKEFETFFDASFDKMYGFEFRLAEKLGYLQKEKDGSYKMTHKGAFYYHYYEQYYTLAYIDKMWGIMKNEAFPEKIEL